jgi:putative aldouronate transport system permease protein
MQNQPQIAGSSLKTPVAGNKTFFQLLIRQRALLLMSVPLLIWLFIFRYYPLWGWSMAFMNYRPGHKLTDQHFVGFDQFKFMFTDDNFLQVLRNTLAMSFISLVLGTCGAIALAILLNELRKVAFKRVVQTISYLPHFISWVVAANIISDALSPDGGIINRIFVWLGLIKEPVMWLGVGHDFWTIFALSDLWKSIGWNTIVYLAAITTIDPSLYEAAEIDGAGRFKRIWHVTLPGMRSIIILLGILSIGNLMQNGFEAQWLLGNGMNIDYSQNLDVFVLKYGIQLGNFSLATAAGMFKTVVSFILLFSANSLARRFGQERIF